MELTRPRAEASPRGAVGYEESVFAAIIAPATKVPSDAPRLVSATTSRMRVTGWRQNPRSEVIESDERLEILDRRDS